MTVAPADALSLTITGPFAEGLTGQADNLILRAVTALSDTVGTDLRVAITLDKRLPIAAGLGGGSSDAGMALGLVDRLLGLNLGKQRLSDISRVVGADGPMCFAARSAWTEGIGERLAFEPRLPVLHAVLANPARPSPTAAVYRAYDAGPPRKADRPPPPPDWSPSSVIDWLASLRNDLEAPAVSLEAAIGDALEQMRGAGAKLTRMSGSGATVFGLFLDVSAAEDAALRIKRARPDWWVETTTLGQTASDPA